MNYLINVYGNGNSNKITLIILRLNDFVLVL